MLMNPKLGHVHTRVKPVSFMTIGNAIIVEETILPTMEDAEYIEKLSMLRE